MGFEVAIQIVKAGDCAARRGWADGVRIYLKGQHEEIRDCIVLGDPKLPGLMPWIPTHDDLLADDWECVDGPEDG